MQMGETGQKTQRMDGSQEWKVEEMGGSDSQGSRLRKPTSHRLVKIPFWLGIFALH